jgi:hypothetical protein
VVVVKRKTLFDLITHQEMTVVPRTVVLQRGKKGFGFVLRGAKTTDNKFEPSLEVPALQFLESVDKDSNAEKAQLKPLDFVLEINNIDVSSKTHYECVKLIKKTGDTLALKVYTANGSKPSLLLLQQQQQQQQQQANLTSTSSSCGLYQTPCSIFNSNSSHQTTHHLRSQSYYAASTISNSNMNLINDNNYYHANNNNNNNSMMINNSHEMPVTDLSSYLDRTKSLPSKKKHELDKTLAEYDTTNNTTTEQDIIALTNKTKLLANDANAASIRTRVPVRKPGITNGELFNVVSGSTSGGGSPLVHTNKQQYSTPAAAILNLNQRTLSVPNLFQSIISVVPPPPPPPPPLLSQSCCSTSNQYSKSHIYSAPINSTRDTTASNSEPYDYSSTTSIHNRGGSGIVNLTATTETNDYDESHLNPTENSSQNLTPAKQPSDLNPVEDEPAIDYDQTTTTTTTNNNKVTQIQMSTFNHSPTSACNNKANNNNNNLILMMLKQQQQQQQQQTPQPQVSPLTPRQIKQRNCAKRNSVPRSISSNPGTTSPQQQQQLTPTTTTTT